MTSKASSDRWYSIDEIEKLAQMPGDGEENLRQLYDWQHQRESMLVQIVAAALLAVVGGLLASLLSVVPKRDYWIYWPEGLLFLVIIAGLFWALRQRWQQLQGLSREFFIGLDLLHKQCPDGESVAGEAER